MTDELKKLLEEKQEALNIALETLAAIKNGTVDGIIRATPKGDQVYVLKGADEPYRNLIEEMNEGAILLSEDETILYSNRGLAKLVKAPLEKIIGTSIKEWVSNRSVTEFLELIAESRRSSLKKKVVNLSFQTKKGKFIPSQVSINTINLGSNETIGLIITDLTEHMETDVKKYTAALEKEITYRKKAEETLKQRTQQLEETQKKLEESATQLEEYANQMEQLARERLSKLRSSERLATIGQVAGMVGHDIRNPLQAITNDLYLAISDLRLLPPSGERENAIQELKSIEENIDYVNKIVADLQDYAKILKPDFKEINLPDLCSQVFQKNKIPPNIEATCKVNDDCKVIKSDANFLQRILANLVSNAIQAMPNGGKLNVSIFQEDKEIIVSVQDTGIGIPEDLKPKLFTPLFTTRSKGQGFGLPVVKRMIEALEGDVSFESQVGKGTTFKIRIPKQT